MADPSVVLDTNIVVSAHLNALGPSYRIYDLALRRGLLLFVSELVLAEYESVLRRPRLKIPHERVAESMVLVRGCATLVAPSTTLAVLADESDNRFLECAEAANADFLVTGNRRHFPASWKKTRIVTPRELIESLLIA
jgi:uncharacterized protein